MTRARAPIGLSDLQITSDTSSNSVPEVALYPGPNPEGGKAGSQKVVTNRPPREDSEHWKVAVYPRSARYYGPTSFGAVFLEHQATASEDLLGLGEEVRQHPGAWKYGQPLCMD